MNSLLLHCRPGFEGEVCAEIGEHAGRLNVAGYARARPNSAHAEFVCSEPGGAERLMRGLRFAGLIFPRQWARGDFVELPESERIGVLLERLADYPVCGSLWLEVLDTNEGKELSTFCRKFEVPLRKALLKAGRLEDDPRKPRLLLTFKSGREVFLGLAEANNSAAWPMGIPRLKFPRAAPSRSTLKLEEAWHQFIPREAWDLRLAPGMTAVDLGAAPGGWTWQLVNRHIKVTAVDNGPMAPSLMDSGLVEHVRSDGFVFRPRRPAGRLDGLRHRREACPHGGADRNLARRGALPRGGGQPQAADEAALRRSAPPARAHRRWPGGAWREGLHRLPAALPRSRGSDLPSAPAVGPGVTRPTASATMPPPVFWS
ncbi:23S rRNA (cytidine2498-2'-O)-methyltransferase [Azotobacter beijerinckii]|uniref:23S rRNA (Cytidine2498-2'-O)-methyltransferase n=1 Tax=Azotobacter beijerinckii TaxID=170623 RepID=A0A1I1BJL5_9GAMM|nr:23S rRNA (cytidine2498-2'-O)-methyltransferase [Azotobacter beijerinckii]